jgi:hypothetical protein
MKHEVLAKEIETNLMDQRLIETKETLKPKDLFNLLSVIPKEQNELIR